MIHMILCPGTVEESDCMWYLLQEHLSYDTHVLKSTHALFQKKKSSVLMDNVVGPLLASSLPTQVFPRCMCNVFVCDTLKTSITCVALMVLPYVCL